MMNTGIMIFKKKKALRTQNPLKSRTQRPIRIMVCLLLSFYVLLPLKSSLAVAIAPNADQTIQTFVNTHSGTGVLLKNVGSGQVNSSNADIPTTAASLYKLFVAQFLFYQKSQGALNFDAKRNLSQDAIVQSSENISDCGGPPIDTEVQSCLNAMWPSQPTTSTQVSVDECLPKMIIYSDNICGKFYLDYGRDNGIYKYLSSSGYTNTDLGRGGLKTSPSDVAKLLSSVAQNSLVSPTDSQQLYSLMSQQAHRNKIPAGVPSLEVANKTGEIHPPNGPNSHDAAIIKEGGNTYVLVIMTSLNPDLASDDAVIARFVSNIFGTGTQIPGGAEAAGLCFSGSAGPTVSVDQQLHWPWYVANGGSGGSCACVGTGSLPSYIPEPYNGAFTKAANAHNVAPELIAALFTSEQGHFYGIDYRTKLPEVWPKFPQAHPDPNSGWSVSSADAHGPFQFIPSTWGDPVNMGEDGDGDGEKNPNHLLDAAFGAANYAERLKATLDTPVESWRDFIFSYNHLDSYVDRAIDIYYIYIRDGGGSPSTNSSQLCGAGGVSPDGFVFPQLTSKSQLARQNPQDYRPDCKNPVSQHGPGDLDGGCHHDYLAADIMNDTGTPVVAVRPGKIMSAKESGSVGMTVRLYSDPKLGGDGLWYYFAHMLSVSDGGGLKVTVDDVVQAGDQLGVVGNTGDAQGTTQHTHIDISPVENDFGRGYYGTKGPLLDPQPALKAAYENLPD